MKPKAGETRQGGSAAGILLFNERKSKIMAKTLKKALALFLAVVMVMSTVGMTSIFAAAEDGTGNTTTGLVSGTGVVNSVKADGNSTVKVYGDFADYVTATKTVTKVEGTNELNVSYTVETKQKTEQVKKPLAVCIMVDTSSQMEDESIKAAKNFAKNLNNFYVSLVTFDKDANVKVNWTYVNSNKTDERQRRAEINQIIDNLFNGNIIKKNNNGKGANLDAAFKKAKTQFESTSFGIKDFAEANKITAVITSSRPAYDTANSNPNGQNSTYTTTKAAIDSASKVPGAKYAIYLKDDLNDACYYYKEEDTIENYTFFGTSQPYGKIFNKDYSIIENVCYVPYYGASFTDPYLSTTGTISVADYNKIANFHTRTGHWCHNCGKEAGYSYIYGRYINHCDLYFTINYKTETVYKSSGTQPKDRKDYTSYTMKQLLTAITGSESKVFKKDPVKDFTEAAKSIASTGTTPVTKGYTGEDWVITETLGEMFSFVDANGNITNDRSKTVTLGEASKITGTDGTTTYTYKVAYTIAMDTCAKNFDNSKSYSTGSAQLRLPASLRGQAFTTEDPDLIADFAKFTAQGTASEFNYFLVIYREDANGTVTRTGSDKKYSLAKRVTNYGGEPLRAGAEVTAPTDNDVLSEADLANYHVAVSGTKFTIDPDGSNEMTFYCDRDTTSVTINRYYQAFGDKANGDHTDFVADKESSAWTAANCVTISDDVYVGEEFTVKDSDDLHTYQGSDFTYSLYEPNTDKGAVTITLDADSNKNVINYYYTCKYDLRENAGIIVNYYYSNNSWEDTDCSEDLGNGITRVSKKVETKNYPKEKSGDYYAVEKIGFNSDGTTLSGDRRATESYGIVLRPKDGYKFDAEKTEFAEPENGTYTITLQPGINEVNVYYYDDETNAPTAVTVNVNHNYTTYNYSINAETGRLNTQADENPDVDTDTVNPSETVYIGEKLKVEKIDKEGFTYQGSDNGVRDNIMLGLNEGESSIEIGFDYRAETRPDSNLQTVNHVYREYHMERNYTYENGETDEEGNPIPDNYADTRVYDDEPVETVEAYSENEYVGATYKVNLSDTRTVGDEQVVYTFVGAEINGDFISKDDLVEEGILEGSLVKLVAENEEATIDLIYERDKNELDDKRDEISNYTIYGKLISTKTYVGTADGEYKGKVVTKDFTDDNAYTVKSGTGRAFDSIDFDDEIKTVAAADDHGDYTRLDSESGVSDTLKVGSNNYYRTYTRAYDELTKAAFNVTFNYIDKVMTVNEDHTGWTWVEKTPAGDDLAGAPNAAEAYTLPVNPDGYTGPYVGQFIEVQSGAFTATDEDGNALYSYAEAANTTYNYNPQLASGENANNFTYNYYREIELPKKGIDVKHVYFSQSVDAEGNDEPKLEESLTDGKKNDLEDYVGLYKNVELNKIGTYALKKVTVTYADGSVSTISDAEALYAIENSGYSAELGYVTAVEFEYLDDSRKPATYSIWYQKNYYDYTEEGTRYTDYSRSSEGYTTQNDDGSAVRSSYVNKFISVNATPDEGYELVDIKFNGESKLVEGQVAYSFQLEDGKDNNVEMFFEHIEKRPTEVTVYHVYTKKDSFRAGTDREKAPENDGEEASYIEKVTITYSDNNNIWIGNRFDFTDDLLKTTHNELDYEKVSVEPSTFEKLEGNIVDQYSSETPQLKTDLNKIVVTYQRSYDSQAKGIVVTHKYTRISDITNKAVGEAATVTDTRDYLGDIAQGESFTVQPIYEYADDTYELVSNNTFTATPDENGKMEFTVEYELIVHETIANKIGHNYYVVNPDGSKTSEGSEQNTVTGNLGDVKDITLITTHDENGYECVTPESDRKVTVVNDSETILQSVDYYRYEYDVKFDLNGGDGTAPAAQIVKKDATASKPADPERDGFNFTSWKLGTAEYDFATPVVGNITLVAQWEAKPEPAPETPVNYIVKFDLNGGDGTAPADQTVASGTTASKPTDPVRDGFNFTGWTLDGAEYDFTAPVTADITLKASWQEKPEEVHNYVVKFDTNGGSDAPADQTVAEGGKAFKPADPTRYSYSFAGWLLNGAAYDFDAPVTADITLVADWTPAAPVNPTPVYPNYPAVVPTVPGETELPDAEVPLSELPDMEVPLGDLPEEELPEDEVPLAAAPSVEEEELEEDLIPLGDAPATGDSGYIVLYAILMLVSALGLVAIAVTSRRKKEDNC